MLPPPIHVRYTYAFCGWSPYVATFHADPTELDRFTVPQKKCSRLHLSTWLSGPRCLNFSSNITIKAVHLSQTYVDEQATRLTGPISLACDQYVQYLLTGVNPSVLNQHRWGLQPWKCRLATSHPRPSQLTTLYFPPKDPAWSQVIKYQHKPLTIFNCKAPNSRVASMLPDLYQTYNYI
jgi:hypothetical protein